MRLFIKTICTFNNEIKSINVLDFSGGKSLLIKKGGEN